MIDPRWAILAGLVALGAVGGWFARDALADRAMARVEADMATQREQAAAAAVKASEAARAEERRRSARHQEVTKDAIAQADAARRDAADAHGAAEQLRQSILHQLSSDTGNSSRCDSATTRAGETASAAGLVLADVCGRGGARAAELAAALDAARVAGLACERAYEALSGR